MATHRASRPADELSQSDSRLSQLWQLPLFLVSLGLFVYAGYLFIDPGGGATIDQKIAVARDYLKQNRPDAAWQQLVRLFESEKLPKDKEASVHLLLAQAMEGVQHEKRIDIPANDLRIIEQTELALNLGAKPTSDLYRRLGNAYSSLNRVDQAVTAYGQAIALDPAHSLPTRRKLIELQLANDDAAGADVALDEYLKQPEITDAERAWALDQRAGILIDERKFAAARSLLSDALRLDTDPVDQGQFNYQLGYCAYREGQPDDAERYLRLSRDQLRVEHPLDADAAYYLGRIYQDRNDPANALAFYDDVLTSHPEAKVAPLAQLGRGICRIIQGQTDAGLTDLHDLTMDICSHPNKARDIPQTVNGLRQSAQILVDREDYQSALELMAYEQTLESDPPPPFFARLGDIYARRADQLEATLPDATPADKIRRSKQISDLRTKAGDAYVVYSHDLTLSDDHGYADAMWHGIDLYDRAGNLQSVISALELFVSERPDDRLAPDALLRLGQAYQAAGLFDKAIDAYQRNELRYPKSLAASKSAIPLAQAYIAKGPEFNVRAEKTLLGVVEDNPLVDPKAEEFRQALRDLAQLYYRTGRYEEAIARLQELTARYPNDEQKPQMLFMMADSYRKSASLLDAKIESAQSASIAGPDIGEALAAKHDRLLKARGLYDQVIDMYRGELPTTDIDKLYQKLAYFYRADCMYDLGNYEEAIKLYDAAAFDYQNDPSSVAAYVQIVNSYFALGKPEEAKAANNRAKWMLQHMPADAFQDGTFSMPKKYWDQWLQWTNNAGMW